MRLIDADALHRSFEEVYEHPVSMFRDSAWWFFGKIEDEPTVDAAPVVHGRWIGEEINIETGDISATLQECSVCHRIRPVDSYCSHCGAKMYLPEDGE